ncbi:MAG: hypothetical protein O2960_27355 [Verrucomicrobia bacterium]|nr:hypothetical protein [Verrucomicrobiota bacterium]
MKANLKPASSKAWVLFNKLQALAEQGIDGEKISAQKKIERLKKRFDFSTPDAAEAPDLFAGNFKRSTKARQIFSFAPNELDVANSVKWAIESATKIQCLFRDGALLTEATPSTANRLAKIADHIALSFRALLDKFSAIDGVSVTDRGVFVMGLYDGMMNEVRNAGQRLPSRSRKTRVSKSKKRVATGSPSLHVHPYTVAVNLGKQIRFAAPLEQITAELEAVIRGHLTPEQP